MTDQMQSLTQNLTQTIFNCYQKLQQKRSNLVLELVPSDAPIYQWQHYPKGDIKDIKNRSQYYYHAHPSKDDTRALEHGHFHLFFRHDLFSPTEDKKLIISTEYEKTAGKKDNLTHLIAIAMNELGLPTALFTVNYWVVLGVWYPANVLIKYLDNFYIHKPESPYAITNQWVNAMVQLFRPQIEQLLVLRDEVINAYQAQHPKQDVYSNKSLEITSLLRLTGERPFVST